jgi:hypothetical protein
MNSNEFGPNSNCIVGYQRLFIIGARVPKRLFGTDFIILLATGIKKSFDGLLEFLRKFPLIHDVSIITNNEHIMPNYKIPTNFSLFKGTFGTEISIESCKYINPNEASEHIIFQNDTPSDDNNQFIRNFKTIIETEKINMKGMVAITTMEYSNLVCEIAEFGLSVFIKNEKVASNDLPNSDIDSCIIRAVYILDASRKCQDETSIECSIVCVFDSLPQAQLWKTNLQRLFNIHPQSRILGLKASLHTVPYICKNSSIEQPYSINAFTYGGNMNYVMMTNKEEGEKFDDAFTGRVKKMCGFNANMEEKFFKKTALLFGIQGITIEWTEPMDVMFIQTLTSWLSLSPEQIIDNVGKVSGKNSRSKLVFKHETKMSSK